MIEIVSASFLGPDPSDRDAGLPPDFVRTSDRVTRLALRAAQGALRDAGPLPSPDRAGLVTGIDAGIYPTVAACLHRMIAEGTRSTSPQEFTLATPNIPLSQLAIRLGWRGPATNVACGTLSSLVAVGVASDLLRNARADVVLAGGASSALPPLPHLAQASGLSVPVEAAAFFLLRATEKVSKGSVEIARFCHRRLRDRSLNPLLDEVLADGTPEEAIVHPGPPSAWADLPRGIPPVTLDLSGDPFDAAGAVALFVAFQQVRREKASLLVVQRSFNGREAAALLLRRPT